MAVPDRVTIDSPAPGTDVPGWARISGWTIAGDLPAEPVVTVDGEPAVGCFWRVCRPDVVAHFGLTAGLDYGFEGWVDLRAHSGPVTLAVHADGRADLEPASLEVIASPASTAKVRIDGPSRGQVTLDTVEVFGWAYGVHSSIESIEVDGPGISQDADYGALRSEIDTEGVSAPTFRCGWSTTVDVSDAGTGFVPVVVVVTDEDGRKAVVWNQLRRIEVGEPLVEVERIEHHGDRTKLTGYVVWPSPTPEQATVALARDGVVVASAPADRARPDLARQFPDRVRDQRCGFVLWAPRSPGGASELSVRADDGRYTSTVLAELEPPTGVSSEVPDTSALLAATQATSAVLDWGVGVDGTALPITVFTPPFEQSATLPYRDSSIDFVVVPSGTTGDRLGEAERVAQRAVLAPDQTGTEYETLWEGRPDRVWPSVSIVIPVHGQDEVTDDCLRTLLETLPEAVEAQVIVVDDASPEPSTATLLDEWSERDARVHVVSLADNVGYLRAVNLGAEQATGEFLVLLNNDTELLAGWLEALLGRFERQPESGVVGARLVYEDGDLQDAGGIIFADGSAWNLGRGGSPDNPAFRHFREVHYCTAAAFMTPTALWREIGAFDERFVPAYYEDVDYCMAVRAAGRPVVIEPDAVVIHKEGRTHGVHVDSGVKANQLTHQRLFAEKWAAALVDHPERPEAPDATAIRKIVMTGRG